MNLLRTPVCIVVCLIGFSATAQARFVMPGMVPVDRLLKNMETYLRRHKTEAHAHYTLARIYYLAFFFKRDHAPAFMPEKADDKPQVIEQWMAHWLRGDNSAQPRIGVPLSNRRLVDHAVRASRSYAEAIRLEPNNALYHLGLASLLEDFWRWNDTTKLVDLPSELRAVTVRNFRDAYSKAFRLAIVDDSKLQSLPLAGLESITANEAAAALVRIAAYSQDALSETEKQEVKEAEEAIAKFRKLRMAAITPIVFSFRAVSHLAELLALKLP